MKRFSTYTLFVTLCCLPGLVAAGTLIDALSANPDSNKIKTTLNLAKKHYFRSEFDSARYYATQAAILANTKQYTQLAGNAALVLGAIYQQQNLYQKAISQYEIATIKYTLAHDKDGLAKSLLNKGICKQAISRYQEAIDYYLKACNAFQGMGDSENLANALNSVSLCFVSLEKYDQALHYCKRAMEYRLIAKDKIALAQSYNNLGYILRLTGKLDSAQVYLRRSIDDYTGQQDSSLLIIPLQNYGAALMAAGKGKYARRPILRSLKIANQYGRKEDIAKGQLDLAELCIQEKIYGQGSAAAVSSLNIATALRLPELMMRSYALLSHIEEARGNTARALSALRKSHFIRDSLFSVGHNIAISEMEIRYSLRQKERDILYLRAQRALSKKVDTGRVRFIAALIGVAVLLLIISLLLYRSYRLSTVSRKHIITLMRDLHHRVKNNLQILSGLFVLQINSLNDNQAKKALKENQARLAAMNLIHQRLYQDEFATTAIDMPLYINDLLQNIYQAFGGPSAVSVSILTELEQLSLHADIAVAIGLLINELTTNSFKHVFTAQGSGTLTLRLNRFGKSMLRLEYNDSGNATIIPGQPGGGFGTQIIDLMIRQLEATLSYTQGAAVFMVIDIPIA